MSPISGDRHIHRHHAALDEGQAHAEPQADRQEQNARPMPGPAFHRAPKMVPSAIVGKVLLFGDASQVEHLRQLAPRSAGNINNHGHPAASVDLYASVGDVMVNVAVQEPLPRIARGPDDVVALGPTSTVCLVSPAEAGTGLPSVATISNGPP
jgi:hypothetical protein